ncbi:MAG: outer membrane beta-barrel protein [Sulfurovaceae bacterium]|nr:outer membrane beta-barrel protein [Sulfurovaceae bacterium]
MKKFTLSVVTVLSMSAFAVAGGDIEPVEPEVVVPAPAPVMVEDESGFYLGVAYSREKTKEDYDDTLDTGTDLERTVGTGKVDYNGIMAQAGYKFNKYIALEGRYWWSLGNNDWDWSESYYLNGSPHGSASGSISDDEKLKAWGVYVKPMYPVTDQFDIYALLGGGNVRLSDNGGKWLDENDFQWGLGASYEITENISIFADYVRLLDKDGSSTTIDLERESTLTSTWDDTVYTINVGLTYKF